MTPYNKEEKKVFNQRLDTIINESGLCVKKIVLEDERL